MSRRWYWWAGSGLVAVLLALAAWRMSLQIPEMLRMAEKEMAAAAARSGLEIRHGGLRLHLLHLYLSLDNVVVRDVSADAQLARAGVVELSLSPLRLLKGELPVSRVRIRDFLLEAGERNRPLFEKLTSGGKGEGGALPEILFVNGSVRLGPIGPVRRFEATVQELRLRESRFSGTRISAYISGARGEIGEPGGGAAAWPYPSLELDLASKGDTFRIRRIRAWGGPSGVRASGIVDIGKRTADWKASGDVDLARWIASEAPLAGYARKAVRSGKLEFSAAAAGPWDNPRGSARISLHGGTLQGGAPMAGGGEVSLSGRTVRIGGVQGTIAGGSLSAAGTVSLDSGRFDGKLSLHRLSLAAVPWETLGSPWRLAGTADLETEVAGTADDMKGALSLSLPGGFEGLPRRGQGGFGVGMPVSVNLAAEVTGGKTVRLETVRLQAGRAEIRGQGEGSLSARTVRLHGTAGVPAGRAAEYGWDVPLSWDSLGADWELHGPLDHVRARLSIVASGVTARTLPPLALMAKIDGSPGEALHFVADLPADAFKVTAVGTLTAPLDPAKARGEISIAVRDVDLGKSRRWASAVAVAAGQGPEAADEYVEGIRGIGEGDGRIVVAAGAWNVSGTIRFPEVLVRGVPLHSVKAAGDFDGKDGRWSARCEGRLGDGTVAAAANGTATRGPEVHGEIRGLEIAQLLSLLKGEGSGELRGKVDARVSGRQGPHGWEFSRISASSREISFGTATVTDVRAEGHLGAVSGAFDIEAASPRLALSGDVQRGDGWPARFALTASELPTSFLLAAAGRDDLSSGGRWSADAKGIVRLADLFEGKTVSPEAFPALRGSVTASDPSVGEAHFRQVTFSGDRKGDSLAGELVTEAPATRLSWEVSLREPFGFRLEGPFSFGENGDGGPTAGKAHLALRGNVRIHGALRAVEKTEGTIRVDSVTYRDAGFELSGQGLEAQMDPEGIRWAGGTVRAAGSPVRISGKVSWKGNLDLRLEGKLPAGLVRLAVPGVFDRLDGVVTMDLRITGTPDAPTIVGTGHLENGTLSFLDYAQQFEAMKADAVLSKEKIVFEHFEGRSGGGYIDGWGEVPLATDAGQRMYFSVDFMDMRYPYPEEIRPVVQGHVELFGPVDGLVVTGSVEVQSARYTRTMYPERALLDFSRRLSDVAARREKSEFRVRLDIDVTADRTIRIRNNLADATASGDFKVQGDSGKVIILGSFDVDEGYVEFYGNRYELKRVTVDFQDPRRNNPRLDARAETKKSGYTITVMVSGTLDKPQVDFSSDPPLSQTDIVSLLSFGVTTQTLATPGRPASGTGTATGAAIAIGTIGGVDETIRGGLGLDKFSIETGFSQTTQTFEPRFVMRKSFEDRVSVSVSTSIGTSAETSAEGEVRLLEHTYLQGGWVSTTTNTQGQVSGDLKWRYRFQSLQDIFNGGD